MSYFVLIATEDGFSVREMTKEKLLREMANEENSFGLRQQAESALPPDSDPDDWGTKMVIIKGEIVVPVAKKIVTEFDLD